METEEEFAAALDTLQRRCPEELAAFIVSLLYGAPPGIRSYVEAFIAAAERSRVTTIVRHEIGALRVGEREYDVRHRRSAEIVARAGYTLGIIERVVLPSDVALARKLLSDLLDAEQQIAELKAQAAAANGRKTLPVATMQLLAKQGIGSVDGLEAGSLDAALTGLSLEQRVAVKAQLIRTGALA